MIGTYDIVIDGPKRHGRGTLEIEGTRSPKTARFSVDNFGTFEVAVEVDGTKLAFSGEVSVPEVGAVFCEAAGEIWGNSIDATCQTDRGEATVYGTRISSSTGDGHGNDPLWAGRWSDAY